VNPRCKVDSSILKINSSEIRLVLFFCFFPCKKVNFQAVNEDYVSLHNYIIVREIGETAHVVVFFYSLGKFLLQTVQKAVRFAHQANIFMVFVILDNPANKDSILDIRFPIFRPSKPPEIKSYMEQFPFPFYIILRDINALPQILSDALRQWFELVASME